MFHERDHARGHEPGRPDGRPSAGDLGNLHDGPPGRDFHAPPRARRNDLEDLDPGSNVDRHLDAITSHRNIVERWKDIHVGPSPSGPMWWRRRA